MTYRSVLSDDEIAEARQLRRAGRHWDFLGKRYSRSPETVRRALDPGYRERRSAQIAAAKKNGGRAAANPMISRRSVDIPDDVNIDRLARLLAPRSVTATLCGDPAPGQSALDKKRNEASSS